MTEIVRVPVNDSRGTQARAMTFFPTSAVKPTNMRRSAVRTRRPELAAAWDVVSEDHRVVAHDASSSVSLRSRRSGYCCKARRLSALNDLSFSRALSASCTFVTAGTRTTSACRVFTLDNTLYIGGDRPGNVARPRRRPWSASARSAAAAYSSRRATPASTVDGACLTTAGSVASPTHRLWNRSPRLAVGGSRASRSGSCTPGRR